MDGTTNTGGVIKLRTGQREFMRGLDRYRLAAFVARRQYGKTTTFSAIALRKMMKRRDHTVIFGSAKLSLAREIVRKEAAVMQKAISAFTRGQAEGRIQVSDGANNKVLGALREDDFAELFEAQRLEFRYYHDRLSYSRTKVVALTPDTVGETGDLMADELRAIRNWREVWEAIEPIIASDPTFRCTLSTTVPRDDTHYAFEQLTPPIGTDFKPNPKGNWYRTEMGINVLRLDAWDAYADGVPVYDLETGEALTPDEHRRRASDKDAWDRNYGEIFKAGGTAACALLLLDTAQRRSMAPDGPRCRFFMVEDEGDFEASVDYVKRILGAGRVGLGFDVATTEKETSNPASFVVVEEVGIELWARAIICWKTAEPTVARARVRLLVEAVAERKDGGAARRLKVDATNERYFAKDLKDDLRGLVPVTLVVGSEKVEKPGAEPMTSKAFLGNQLVGLLEDNHLVLPADRYVREDFRRVKRNKGSFECELGPNGEHGDTFDGTKLAIDAVIGTAGGPAEVIPNIAVGGNSLVGNV